MIRRIVFAILLSLAAAVPARAQGAPPQDHGDFGAFVAGLRQDALGQGISAATLDRAFAGISYIPHVIELDRRQPESTLAFEDYISRVMSPGRLDGGREKLAENRELLEQIGQRYGVEPRFIVALWGIETDYGRITGNFSEIGALATLAYDGRRSAFFRKELMNALVIVDREHVDPRQMTGSWAGAMGQSQFMPSSYLAYAVSWSGDGPPDIWNNRADILASIANYLAKVGWHAGAGWGVAATAPPDIDPTLVSIKEKRPLAEWAALGVVPANPAAAADGSRTASLIEPGGAQGPALLVFDNFRVILRWNNSSYFATAVGYLADGFN